MNLTLKQALSYFWQKIVLTFAKNTDLEKKLEVDITDAEEGSANLINADSLGGVLASDYALKSDLEDLGGTEVQIELDTTLTQSGMAADAAAVGNHINDKNNPHSVTAEQIGAAPDGFITSGTIVVASEEELEAALSERFAAMSNKTVRYFYINATSSNIFGGTGTQCELSRWTGSDGGYGFARFTSYGSNNVNVSYKSLRAGVWKPMEDGSTSAFAPAGYGLGTEPTFASDANVCKDNGWFIMDPDTANKPLHTNWGIIFVKRRNHLEVVQEVVEVTHGYKAQRYSLYGEWQPWEYVNPPMEIGIEYRTTERIEGKAVYKKNIDGVINYRLDGETTWQPYATALGATAAWVQSCLSNANGVSF